MENLPSEILLHIFDLLDSETLRNVAVLCSRFQSLIHNSNHIMAKFRACINLSNLNIAKKTLSDMPYRKFDIFASSYFTRMSLGRFEGKINSIIGQHTENIENLRLYDSTTGLASKILVNLENLTHLCIERIQKSLIEEDDALFSITLPNLKILEVDGVDSYLKCLRCPKIETLIYRNVDSPMTNQNAVSRSLNNFFKRSRTLKDFTMFGAVPNFETEKFEFKLQKLKFTNYATNVDETEDSPMMKLLKSQKDNIRDLTVTEYVTQDILGIAINEMKNLEKLKLDLDKIFAEPRNLRMNFKLKKLEIINLPNFHEHVLKIIKNCPNVEILKFLCFIPGMVLSDVSSSMKNLQILTFESTENVDLSKIAFNNLKKLSIWELSNQDQLITIFRVCSASANLTELEIVNITYELTSVEVDILIKICKNVEILKLHGHMDYDDPINMVFYGNQTKLRLLVLDIFVDEERLELVQMLHDTKIQCIVPDAVNAYRYYTDKRGPSCDYLDQISVDDLESESSDDDSEDLSSERSENSDGCPESEDFSDFYDQNLTSCDENFSDCSNTDTSCSQCCNGSIGFERAFRGINGYEGEQVVPNNSRNDQLFPRVAEYDQELSNNENHISSTLTSYFSKLLYQKPEISYFKQLQHPVHDVGNSIYYGMHMNLTLYYFDVIFPQIKASSCPTSYPKVEVPERLDNENPNHRKRLVYDPDNDLYFMMNINIAYHHFNNHFGEKEDPNAWKFRYYSKRLRREVQIMEVDQNLANTAEQVGLNNELSNAEDEEGDVEMEIDADDEQEIGEDYQEDSQVSESDDESQEGFSSSNNQESSPRSQFQIIQIESLFDMSDENDDLGSNQDPSTNNDESDQNSSNSEDPLHIDDQQNLSSQDENSDSSSISEGDMQVEIAIHKRPREDDEGISSEEDIFIEIIEGKKKIRKTC
ncbi:unnamed protein product [Chironomus riparius]|uniref:F-box domain-containing protein n=1 Tax=Chironomus riparius TaxID=315576 RepID=A0A9N9WYK7_9DIPT|nr:unnamed protein product [Chironomus riparius]